MLTQIHIRDLATIEELHLELQHGTTMITGETGAGKSIFIEAIELALGGRASQSIVRNGKDKAYINLCFDITNFPKAIAFLKALDLYMDNPECIIRRIIMNDGRSRCYINGFPVTVNLVKELGELLFHLHGQHEQQVLLNSETQREMLDRYADHLPLAQEIKAIAEEWKSMDLEVQILREKMQERSARMEYLHFQLEELQALKLQAGEWATLEAQHSKLANAEELLRQLQSALQQITDEDKQNLLTQLNDVRKIFEAVQSYEPQAKIWLETVNSSLVQLTELGSDLENYLEKTELDPEKLQQVEERVSQIYALSRKHKVVPEKLLDFTDNLISELSLLTSSDENLAKLEERKRIIADQYQHCAAKLSAGREKAAAKFEQEISATIRSLSLPHGMFKIGLEKNPQAEVSANLAGHGNEKIIFLIKTNPDQALQTLSKVISGGELSRLSLACHLALANRTTIPTLVFDEVDTGLSGATAEKIGKLLQKLGSSYQVFCVTHQAQVAACGHHHLLVEKYFVENTTHTGLRLLDEIEKTREIARMLGGEKITQKTLEHAKEMLAMA